MGKDLISGGIAAAKWFKRHRIPLLPQVIQAAYYMFGSCAIPYDAKIDRTVRFRHRALGCVIHRKATIGAKTVVRQNVTIGVLRTKEDAPAIGKNCDIGSGACILGGITIGDNVKIGANSVVLCDVPDNCTAVGSPARIITPKSDAGKI